MALTNCRECGKMVSTEARACPHCGCASPGHTSSSVPTAHFSSETYATPPDLRTARTEGIVGSLLSAFIWIPIIGQVMLVFGMLSLKQSFSKIGQSVGQPDSANRFSRAANIVIAASVLPLLGGLPLLLGNTGGFLFLWWLLFFIATSIVLLRMPHIVSEFSRAVDSPLMERSASTLKIGLYMWFGSLFMSCLWGGVAGPMSMSSPDQVFQLQKILAYSIMSLMLLGGLLLYSVGMILTAISFSKMRLSSENQLWL